MQGSIRWLYLPGDPHVEGADDGHGTCVASKVASPTFGVAKSANIVVVKMAGEMTISRYIAAFAVITGDIASANMQGKAVVCNTLNSE